jgi:SNF2 family DNA or RNA helicase
MRKDAIGAPEALAAYLSDESSFSPDLCSLFDGFLSKASGMDKKALPPPAGLKARFRPYQERGYRWLAAHQELGMGCLLADDMGLGKTSRPSLSSSTEGNRPPFIRRPRLRARRPPGEWERELSSFAPSLSVVTYYGAARTLKRGGRRPTSYETFTRDAEKSPMAHMTGKTARTAATNEASKTRAPFLRRPPLKSKPAVNAATSAEPGTSSSWTRPTASRIRRQAARAVKSARARGRIALTGTPVENHLGEFWSIFDFIMPGYLGNPTAFMRTFRRPIEVERNREAAERLTRLTAPFILRRLKTTRP